MIGKLSEFGPRTWGQTLLLGGAAASLICLSLAGPVRGQQPAAAPSDVPVKRVVLFSSGVGYFEHRGTVQGDATVDLRFRVDDVNDLLKSMVLQDLSGGRISTITYGSRDPITKTLQTVAIDLTKNPTLGALLEQIRGESVEINTPESVTGTIVGVERKMEKVEGKDELVEVEYVTLLTEDGLRRIPINSVGRIRLLNAELDSELRQALSVLAQSHATDKKTVTLNFLGQGQRDVRVGYIQESPVWKTSYRLILDDDEKPFLQGWAIVENTSDTDWNNVSLSLVSGRPISFVMDLYSPLYATRPVVQPELYASVRPKVYDQDLNAARDEFQQLAESRAAQAPTAAPAPQFAAGGRGGRGGRGGFGGGGLGGGLGGLAFEDVANGEAADNGVVSGLIRQGVDAATQGGDVGELFRYEIATPVTLARQRSAMLPIINDSVDGEKVSIYNESVQAKHPLNGLRLKNTSSLHLMQGPITVFDGGIYAGDSRIQDLPPGSERLMSYALDLKVEVAPDNKSRPQRLTSARISKGVLYTTYRLEQDRTYTVKNSDAKTKTVLIEHPLNTNWDLITPKEPTEKTRDLYRFAVEAEPGKPAKLEVVEERTLQQAVAMSNLNENQVQIYINERQVSQKVKDAMANIIRQKTDISDLNRRQTILQQRRTTIEQNQNRIRDNMRAISQNTDLYRTYIQQLTQDETQMTQILQESDSIREEIEEKQKSLDEYMLGLEIE